MGTTTSGRLRKRWPEALKREIVAASLAPGASVSVVARQYDVNANQVFSWRKRYRQVPSPPTELSVPRLVPVMLSAEPDGADAQQRRPSAVAEPIEIEVAGKYRIRVGSGFDGQALRRVLDVLGRR
jgi:transposase